MRDKVPIVGTSLGTLSLTRGSPHRRAHTDVAVRDQRAQVPLDETPAAAFNGERTHVAWSGLECIE